MRRKFYAFTFSVEGGGVFPVDMMRYDRCVPYTQKDELAASVGIRSGSGQDMIRKVTMIAFTPVGNKLEPTTGRWQSFGWRVVGDIRPVEG